MRLADKHMNAQRQMRNSRLNVKDVLASFCAEKIGTSES